MDERTFSLVAGVIFGVVAPGADFNGVARHHRRLVDIDGCQRQATEQHILPRDRPQFVIRCVDGAAAPSPPSVVAPEYQKLAAKRAKEKERVDNCQRQATEQKVLPRDRPQFVIHCLEQ